MRRDRGVRPIVGFSVHTFPTAIHVAALICATLVAAGAVAQQSGPEEQIARTRAFLSRVPDKAAVAYRLAVLEAQLGHQRQALVWLKKCLAADEGFDPSTSPTLRKFAGTPEFDNAVRTVHQHFPAVANAGPAFVLTEQGLFPEGIAYDQERKVWYVGSLNLRKILEIHGDGTVRDFVPANWQNSLGIVGIRVDGSDHSVWTASWSEAGNHSELLHFNPSGKLLGRYRTADSAAHGFNDLIIRHAGDVLLTDTVSNHVYRFTPQDGSFGPMATYRTLSAPNGITLSDNDREVFVADDFGISVLDLEHGSSRELNRGPHNTLAGIDGLYWHHGSLVAVQNDIGSPRVMQFKLSNDHKSVVAATVLESRTPFTILPTTGAIVGDKFYFMANTQIDNLKNDRVVDEAIIEPVRIGVLNLP